MNFEEVFKFKLKRVNPFQGLVIDTDTWRDAHDYHRDQQRLHILAFHSTGIVDGLDIVANKPPDLSVVIHPGIAVDPQGNVIVVPETQNYKIQSREKRTIYLIIQFREIPAEPYQPPNGGQPTRIVEAYRIQERDTLPKEPYLELCRINFDPADKTLRDARYPTQIGKNEIDLGYRQAAKQEPSAPQVEQKPIPTQAVPSFKEATTPAIETIAIGHAVMGEASRNLHSIGLQNLMKEINRQCNFAANLTENITIDRKVNRFTLVYITGKGKFELNSEQQAALSDYLQSGGVILGEGCSEEATGTSTRGAREFGLAFNQLATQFKCKLEIVQRGHPLLSACHIFSEVPQGMEAAMLLEGGNMIYSGSDYGCSWQGGYKNKPIPRENIRNALEIGTNIISYARAIKSNRR
jgi:Domain of unknown function (DUF4159)